MLGFAIIVTVCALVQLYFCAKNVTIEVIFLNFYDKIDTFFVRKYEEKG